MHGRLAAGIVAAIIIATVGVATCRDGAVRPSLTALSRETTTARAPTVTEPANRARLRADAAVESGAGAAAEGAPPPPMPAFAPFGLQQSPTLVRVTAGGSSALLQPEGDGEWHDVSDGASREPVASLTARVLLVRRVRYGPTDSEPAFADTRTGIVRAAFPGRQVEIVAIRDGWVLAHDGARSELVRAAPGTEPVVLPAAGVRKILGQSERHVFVQCDGGVFRVPFDGSAATKLAVRVDDLRNGGIVPSPSGKLFAVHSVSWFEEDDAPPALRVVDCEAGTELWRTPTIEVRTSYLASFAPRITLAWPDDARLRYSETYRRAPKADVAHGALDEDGWGNRWVEVSATTGARLAEVPYREGLGIDHDTPPTTTDLKAPEWPRRWGLFRTTYADTWYGDDVDPAAHATWAPYGGSAPFVSVSPDGRWAVACVTVDGAKVVLLLDGRSRTSRVVHGSDLLGLSWIGSPDQ